MDFDSLLSSVNNVEITDLLAILVMLLFSSICSHPKIICGDAYSSRKLQDYENLHGGDYFLRT